MRKHQENPKFGWRHSPASSPPRNQTPAAAAAAAAATKHAKVDIKLPFPRPVTPDPPPPSHKNPQLKHLTGFRISLCRFKHTTMSCCHFKPTLMP